MVVAGLFGSVEVEDVADDAAHSGLAWARWAHELGAPDGAAEGRGEGLRLPEVDQVLFRSRVSAGPQAVEVFFADFEVIEILVFVVGRSVGPLDRRGRGGGGERRGLPGRDAPGRGLDLAGRRGFIPGSVRRIVPRGQREHRPWRHDSLLAQTQRATAAGVKGATPCRRRRLDEEPW